MNSDPLTLIHSDALTGLTQLVEDESVQTCVTSPPYWGLRDYGTEPLVWDNHNGCEHEWTSLLPQSTRRSSSDASFCKCGAWRGCLGLEPTPELYVQHLVEIFREVKRVLKKDGTLWLNLGDSYAGSGKGPSNSLQPLASQLNRSPAQALAGAPTAGLSVPDGLKAKDLVGIPWMVAFALRADGWYLRSDIIWSKPNPMPESVTDRPTKSHEYIFLLSKSQRYFFDAEAVKEPVGRAKPCGRNSRENVDRDPAHLRYTSGNKERKIAINGERSRLNTHMGSSVPWDDDGDGRNIRSVWTIATSPFPDAHFATFPPDLIKPCILAGAPSGGVVMDPFAGSGTTGKVSIELGRKAILIEPKAEYVEMINRRCQTTMGFQF